MAPRVTTLPDGKVEHVYADGRRELHFVDGSIKESLPDGHVTVRFFNGDIKQVILSI